MSVATQLSSHQSPAVVVLNRWPDVAAAGFTCGLLALGALTMFRRVQSCRRQRSARQGGGFAGGKHSSDATVHTSRREKVTIREKEKVSRRRQLTKHHEEMRHRARERKLEIERLQMERSKRRGSSSAGSSIGGQLNQTPHVLSTAPPSRGAIVSGVALRHGCAASTASVMPKIARGRFTLQMKDIRSSVGALSREGQVSNGANI
eukprot:COSAG02_NODE_31_length_50774_cov_1928.118204_23_plen_205_part_00